MIKSVKPECGECDFFIETEKSLSVFHNITTEITSKMPLHDLLDEIIEASKTLLNAEVATLYLYDAECNMLYFHIVTGPKSKELESKYIPLGKGIAGWVAEKKKTIIIDDCYSDERFNSSYDKKSGFKTKNMLCVPMLKKDSLVGVIQVINKIGDYKFSENDLMLGNMLASHCAVAIENARLNEIELKDEQIKIELETARKIQQNILPKKLPEFDDIDVNVKLIPAKETGGDYFNVIELTEDKTLLFIVDVTGKSISAALIVSAIYSFVQTYIQINQQNFVLIDFVTSLNKFLISATTTDKFATGWFGIYNHNSNSIESLNAGHNPVYLLRDGAISELSAGGLLLGSLEFPYDSEKIELIKNDKVVFYTDGVNEAMDSNGEEFGDDNFLDLLKSIESNSAEEFVDHIVTAITAFRGIADQSDDITCGALIVK